MVPVSQCKGARAGSDKYVHSALTLPTLRALVKWAQIQPVSVERIVTTPPARACPCLQLPADRRSPRGCLGLRRSSVDPVVGSETRPQRDAFTRRKALNGGSSPISVGPNGLLSHEALPAVAVGTALAGGPPHRSVREGFPHSAPTLGRASKRTLGYGCRIFGEGSQRSATRQNRPQFQRPTSALTAPTKRTQPQAFDRTLELRQTLVVAGDSMRIVPSLDDTAQPPANISKLPVHTSTQMLFDGQQF